MASTSRWISTGEQYINAEEAFRTLCQIMDEPDPRPTEYTPELAEIICTQLADGATLRQICQASGLPLQSTVRRWALDNQEFANQFLRAQNIGLDCQADEITEIADDRADDPNSRRVRIEARKWLLSKKRPAKYGDHASIEHTGPGGGKLEISFVHSLATVTPIRPEASQLTIETVTEPVKKTHVNGHVFLPSPTSEPVQ